MRPSCRCMYRRRGARSFATFACRPPATRSGWEFIFYATFGIVVTSSVAIAGVLLVFSFLIIPAAIGVMFADRFSRQLAIGWIAGTLASAVGLAAHSRGTCRRARPWSAPSGMLALAGVSIHSCVAPRREAKCRHDRRWVGAIILAVSGLVMLRRVPTSRSSISRNTSFPCVRSTLRARKQRHLPTRANTRSAIACKRSS